MKAEVAAARHEEPLAYKMPIILEGM